MERNYSISIALATYNGEKFIKEQLESILSQLNENDEIVISDDGSTDNTINVIKNINDLRIRIIDGPQKGVKQNFANAISQCSGKYVFLSDQDDIWKKNKVSSILQTFEKTKCSCILHDCLIFDSNTKSIISESFFKYRNSKKGIINNIIKNSYIGCCMAIDSNFISKILPIPNNIEMHDQWIGIMCEKYGKVVFLEDKLIEYRRHRDNVSQMHHYSVLKMLKNRIVFIANYLNIKHYFDAIKYRIMIAINEFSNKDAKHVLKEYKLKKEKINYVSGSKVMFINYNKEKCVLKGFDIFNLYANEAHILKKMNSKYFPSIIKEEKKYFIEEYIEGINLKEFLKNNKDKKVQKKILKEICNILDELEKENIVHRDVRPENLIVCNSTGSLRLIDFGCAVDLNDSNFDFNKRVEDTLGDKYSNSVFWDDALSFYKVINDLNLNDNSEEIKRIKDKIGRLVYTKEK